jgi:predicted RNase H-like HicB family nuclease
MTKSYNVIVEKGIDGYLISSVIELPGCHTQANSYDELMKRTKEAIQLYTEENKNFKPTSKFIALSKLEV